MGEFSAAAPLPAARHRLRLARSIRVVHALIQAAFAALIMVMSVALANGSVQQVRSHAVVASGLALLAVLTVLRGERAQHLLLAVPIAAYAAAAAFDAPGDMSSGLCQVLVLLLAARTLPAVWFAVVALTTTAAMVAIGLAAGVAVSANQLGIYLVGAVNTYVAMAFVAALERSTEAIDRAEQASLAETLRLARVRAEQEAVDSARQVLHDEVLTALRFVADDDGRAGDDDAAWRRRAEDLARAAETSVRTVSAPAGGEVGGEVTGLPGLVESARAAAPVAVLVDIADDVAWQVTARAERAARRAVGEAVRNSHRHAGAETVRLTVTGGSEAVVLSVSDDGAGIAAGSTEGIGMRESIRAPVAAVGGSVAVESSSAGTTVRITLPHRGSGRDDALTRTYALTMAAGGTPQMIVTTVAAMTGVNVVIGAVASVLTPHTGGQLALLVVACLLSVAVARRLRSRAPTRGWVVGVVATLLVLQSVGLAMLPPGGLLDLRSWSVGFLAVPLLVIGFVLPVRWGVAIVALHLVLIGAAVLIEPSLSSGEVPLGSLNAVSISWLTIVLGVVLRRNARSVAAATRAQVEAGVELARQRSRAEASSLHLEHTRTVVVPWLARLGAGQVDPTAPSTRRRARTLMWEARDDLHAPGFHSPDLRRHTSQLRGRGSTVEIRPGLPPGAHGRPSGHVLEVLCEELAGSHRVSVSPSRASDDRVRIVVVPPPTRRVIDRLERSPRTKVSVDEIAATLEIEDATR